MPRYSIGSAAQLSTCHPDIQTLFINVIKYYDCRIIEGHRNEEDQNNAYKHGTSQKQWPDSKHNSEPSIAVDACPYPVDLKNIKKIYHFVGFVKAMAIMLKEKGDMQHDLRCGCDFNSNNNLSDDSFVDAFHYELIIK